MQFFNIILNLSLVVGLSSALPAQNVQEKSLDIVKRTLGDGVRGATGDLYLRATDDCRTDFGDAFVIRGPLEINDAAQAASVWIRRLSGGGFSFTQGRPASTTAEYPRLFQNHEGLQWNRQVNAILQPGQHLFEFPILASGRTYTGGPPGPNRIVVAIDHRQHTDNLIYVGPITHNGMAGNGYRAAGESC
ncbi:hypothetical protein J1614_010688 [Plenodomus biglobosus]|nr:hypothetical protein J1614_010688 [Plenodomus biglobosus]